MSEAQEIYIKYISGDPLSDKELDIGIEHFSFLERSLEDLGPVFRLPAREVGRVLRSLEGFRAARSER